MFDDVGIYRTGSIMESALDKVLELKERFKQVRVTDTGKIFNTELLNAWELGNMLDVAELVTVCVEPDRVHAADIRARIIPTAMIRTG